MRLYLATSNKGKVKEIQALFSHHEVIPYSDVLAPFEIEEHGSTFGENAAIKAQAVYKALNDPDALVLADDSGISVACLDGAPGIYSARFAGVNASDRDNVNKLIDLLKEKNVTQSPAYYTAALALCGSFGTSTVHGWMHGHVTTIPQGTGGFGYDPIFIPLGETQTLGELPSSIKAVLSHRGQALRHLEVLMRGMHLLQHLSAP